jgi:DNA-binding Xre family transcriptional regulator
MKANTEQGNYRVHCRLKKIMRERGLTVEELHTGARVAKETITALRKNDFKGVGAQTIARLCGSLGISVGELFELLPEDIWLPIRLARKVTIHFGSRALSAPRPADVRMPENVASGLYMGAWDFMAFQRISEYLTGLKTDITLDFALHLTGPGRGSDPAVQASARGIFDGGNHIVIGSPIANQFTEEVVCHAYGVAPYNPQLLSAFPYGFAWEAWRKVQSSFGWDGKNGPYGIAETSRPRRIVAPHVVVPSGEGSDGALILTYRVFRAPSQRETADDDERVIICLLGYGGPGTLAAARIATTPTCAAGLYPAARTVPRMRAVRCKHFSAASDLPIDKRELIGSELVPEPPGPSGEPDLRVAGDRPRRR